MKISDKLFEELLERAGICTPTGDYTYKTMKDELCDRCSNYELCKAIGEEESDDTQRKNKE